MNRSSPAIAAYRKSMAALASDDYDQAINHAEFAIQHQYSGGYEAKARALYERGDHQQAISLLEVAVKKFPGVYILWSFLGEFHSNAGRYQDALAAFHQCRNAGDEPEWSQYNIAVVYGRMGDFDQALREIEGAFGGAVPEQSVLSAQAHLLNGVKRYQQAIEAADKSVAAEPTAYALGEKAVALSGLGKIDEAIASAFAALVLDLTDHNALDVLRQYNPEPTSDTKVFKIQYHGKPREATMNALPVDGSYGTFWAAADSPDEALAFYRLIDSELADFSLSNATVEDRPLEGNKGVMAVQAGRTFYVYRKSLVLRLGLWLKATFVTRRSRKGN